MAITASSLGSPPFPILVEAAAAGGFSGLSIWPEATYGSARAAGWSDHDLRAMLDDHGLVVQDVDALVAWVGSGDPGPPYFVESPRETLFAAADVVAAVQISDAPAERPADMADATMHGRLPPGDGVIELVDVVRALHQIGSPAPLTLEVLNDQLLAAHGPHGWAKVLSDRLRTIMAEAGRA